MITAGGIGKQKTGGYDVTTPPHWFSACPVMPAASSELRKSASAATSFGLIKRRCGWWATTFLRYSWPLLPNIAALVAMASRIIAVSTCHGQIAFTVIPRRATSKATDLVNPITAAFVAEYALLCAAPTTPAIEAILMIRPDLA